jgi:hypothetical protein
MGSKLRRLRVRAGVSGGPKGRHVRTRLPAPYPADVAFLDDLPKQFAIMSDSEFSDGVESLRAELCKLQAEPSFAETRATDSELAESIALLSNSTAQSRETIVSGLQNMLRKMALRSGR